MEQGRVADERAELARAAARPLARPARPRPWPRRRGMKVKPEGNPIVVAAFRKRKVDVPEDAGLLYHNKELDAPIAGGPPSVLRASGFGCC